MKIVLDDQRELPGAPYNCVRTYEDCIELLRMFGTLTEYVSLDYDLGDRETGYDVLVYMHEHGIAPAQINIHSDHSVGVPKMRRYAEENFPGSSITFNRL